MTTLYGPSGAPISSTQYKKETPKAVGPAFGAWSEREFSYAQMPGGAILGFDLSRLTLADMRAMRYHPQINCNLSVLTFMLHQVDWSLECDEDPKMAQKLEDMFRPLWTRLVRGLSQSFWAGFSPLAIELENDVPNRRVLIDKFKDLIPEDCEVNWKHVDGAYRPPNVHPGWKAPKFNVYDGIKQAGLPYPIPPENTLWYPLMMENGNYYGRKLLKAAFTPWYFSTLIHLFANRYYERFGEPIPIGRAPFDQDYPDPENSGENITGKEVMDRILAGLRNRGSVNLPSDRVPVGLNGNSEYEFDIKYLESQMRGADFERYLTRLDEEISLSMFTPLLLLRNADVGSHNLGVQHTQTWLWMLNALTGDMGEYITRYAVQRLKALNFSDKAPLVRWVPRPMGKENTETLRAIVSGLIGASKIMPDLDELGVALGMKLHEVKQVTADDPNADPSADPNKPRDRPKSDGPKGVGEPRATGREVSARIKTQIEKAWREKRFGKDLALDYGFHKRFTQSLMAEGASADAAARLTTEFYERMDRWTKDALSLGQTEYSGPSDFMSMFDRVLDSEVDRLKVA